MDALSGTWVGHYKQDSETETEQKENKFEMQIAVDDDDVTGSISDIVDSEEEQIGIASVNGFVDGEEISFIKQYPSLHYRDENNRLIIDESQPHPEIHYHGIISGDRIEGTWDLEQGVVMVAGQYYSNMVSGTWEASKKN